MRSIPLPDPVRPLRILAVAAALCSLAPAFASPQDPDFANLSLEELADIEITTVSRKPELLRETPAPVVVIRGDEIRRSGAQSLPEALRLAANLHVARLDARNYAIGARGFNIALQNKMLVLIDGRTIYSPLFSGVFWEAQDIVLGDIDRIEVISGPGATVWGANAVNGVINIITLPADRSQGGMATVSGGAGLSLASLRYGARSGGFAYRLYAKHARSDDLETESGGISRTGFQRRQVGFRMDGEALGADLTLQGDAYRSTNHQPGQQSDTRLDGANLLGRAAWRFSMDSELRVQAYYDKTGRDQPGSVVQDLDIYDIDIQHTLRFADRHTLVWGGGHRIARDDVRPRGGAISFLPPRRELKWTNVFAQDEFRMTDRLRLTAGLKLERNSYTGVENLPYLSLAFDAAPGHLLWASASRAVRVPSRIDRDLYSPVAPPVVNGVPQFFIAGGPGFLSERARVVQFGYRGSPRRDLHYALTLYRSDYDRLRTLEPNPRGPGYVFSNMAEGETHGAEMTATWDIRPHLRVSLGHTVQKIRQWLKPGSRDISGSTDIASNDPSSWTLLRASWDVSDRVEVDLTARRIGSLPQPAVPSYTAVDVRVGWELRDDLELSLMGQNLFAPGHTEFGPPQTRLTFDRALLAKLTWRF